MTIHYINHDSEPDGMYDKYVVFRHPQEHFDTAIAVVDGEQPYDSDDSTWLEPVDGPVFVLKLDNDHHARVALAAYAESVSGEKPQLANDLREMLELSR